MKNPWGRSGMDMNPWLRVATVVGTGAVVGYALGALFLHVGTRAAFIFGIAFGSLVMGYIVYLMLFLRRLGRLRKERDILLAQFHDGSRQ